MCKMLNRCVCPASVAALIIGIKTWRAKTVVIDIRPKMTADVASLENDVSAATAATTITKT